MTNVDSLQKRLASAAVGIPILLIFVWLGNFWFAGILIVVASIALLEFQNITDLRNLWLQKIPGFVLLILLILNGHQEAISTIPLLFLGLLTLWLSHIATPSWARPFLLTLAGPFYLGSTLAYAILLRNLEHGFEWLLLVLSATFIVDTSAYFGGRLIGRHNLAPKISPSKTWEGSIIGLIASIIATPIFSSVLSLGLELWESIALGIGIGVIAQIGDLIESTLKRAHDKKEAGSIIPGHGGFMDRLDSVVFNLVLVYYVAV